MEKRNKVLMVSKTMSQKRAEDLERITSEYGTMLRMNRSIQAEGSFADVKEDMNFRRYLSGGRRGCALGAEPRKSLPGRGDAKRKRYQGDTGSVKNELRL